KKTLLHDVTTAFAPGKICLLIGPPQAGKTTLLKHISNRIDSDIQAKGTLLYNGVCPRNALVPRIVAYTPQIDNHTPVLTVKQTLEFAFDCTSSAFVRHVAQKGGVDIPQNKEEGREMRNKVNVLLTYSGLENCKDTIVGDGVLRGISGGEKRRLTLAEQLVGTPMVHCMDEITTGLDSAAAYDIVKSLANACHTFHNTSIVSLLQPPPDVVELFDEVLVLGTGGALVYHGPVSHAMKYFCDEVGFFCPDDLPLADFLVRVCSEEAVQLWPSSKGEHPPSCIELAERWKRSQAFEDAILPRFKEAASVGQDLSSNPVNRFPWTIPYGSSYLRLITSCVKRSSTVLMKDKTLVRGLIVQRLLQSVMLGTIFWQTDNDAMKIPMLFLLASLMSMSNMYVVDVTIGKRSIFYKHRDSGFYPTWIYVMAELLSELPLQLLEVVIVSFISFFFVGFQLSTFGVFFLAIFMISISFTSVFKAISANTRKASTAQGLAIGFAALSMCFSGYLVTKQSIPDYFVWIYWIVPTPWILRILTVNEFKSSGQNGRYDKLVVQPGMPAVRLGDIYLQSFSIQQEEHWIWLGFIYLSALIVLCQLLYALGLHFRRLDYERPMIVEPKKPRGGSGKEGAVLDTSMVSFLSQATALQVDRAALELLASVSPQPPAVSLALKDLGYSVRVPAPPDAGVKWTEKSLINNVNALFKPGTITALMGSSGAGKTTLMDVIAGRKTSGTISGQILVNGHFQNLRSFARISGYVEQTDIHIPTQTVREALLFSARHRLPAETTEEDKQKVVEAVIDLVELRPILNKAIGEKGVGLSVEQRKRVTIGVEMVANPSVLFLDEPTSGLDIRAARIIMLVLRRIALSGRTIICTVHQPSQEIFCMFDNLLLLKKGGWTVYNGDLGPSYQHPVTGELRFSGKNMINFFESSSERTIKFQEGMNPAEYMLDVIGAGLNVRKEEDAVDFVRHYQESPLAQRVMNELQSLLLGQEIHFQTKCALGIVAQSLLSVRRWVRSYWRDVGYSLNRLIVVVGIAFLFSLNIVSLDVSKINDQASLQSFNGVLFAGLFFTCAVQTVMTVGVISNSRIVYYKEIAAGMYDPFAFLFGITVAEIPYFLAVVLLHMVIFYPLAGLWTSAEDIAIYAISLFLFAGVFCFWGQMLSALLPSVHTASLAAGPTVGMMVLFCGFFMPESAIPYPWRILYYAFPARYGL
ncbi:hypothetical protein GUITHDRAFT_48863, partial [Guillardia theta CCMP2712]